MSAYQRRLTGVFRAEAQHIQDKITNIQPTLKIHQKKKSEAVYTIQIIFDAINKMKYCEDKKMCRVDNKHLKMMMRELDDKVDELILTITLFHTHALLP